MDIYSKVYMFGICCGVIALSIGALTDYTLLMVFALVPIWLNALLLARHNAQ